MYCAGNAGSLSGTTSRPLTLETGGPERVLLVKGHHAWLAPQIKHTEQYHRQILWSANQGDVMLHLLCRGCRQHVWNHQKAPNFGAGGA